MPDVKPDNFFQFCKMAVGGGIDRVTMDKIARQLGTVDWEDTSHGRADWGRISVNEWGAMPLAERLVAVIHDAPSEDDLLNAWEVALGIPEPL